MHACTVHIKIEFIFLHSFRFLEVTMDSGHTRQRMRPWLESKVESGQIPGLAWIDRDRKIFRVPWKHGGKHDWNEADSTIFKVIVNRVCIEQGLDIGNFNVAPETFQGGRMLLQRCLLSSIHKSIPIHSTEKKLVLDH